ncbi:MAG: PDZ domain-containing protein [Bacteroidetes bacterium]|nr:PDZ domain-containing protein [Bacteroidota bacterium]
MKTYVLSAMMLSLTLSATQAIAQNNPSKKSKDIKSEETIIIKKDGKTKHTTVEIKDGEVYINGEKVANSHDNGNNTQKIIIEDGNGSGRYFFGDNMPMPKKAMLGVYTEADKNNNGAKIKDVMPNSAADEAGLVAGDVITRINDKSVANGIALTEAIAQKEPGEKIDITFLHNGKEKHTEASLSKASQQPLARSFNFDFGNKDFDFSYPMPNPHSVELNDDFFAPTPKMGVTVEETENGYGARILNVKPNSPAEMAGLEKGDVIKKMDDEKILSVDDLQYHIQNAPKNEHIKLQYNRNGENKTTDIVFPKPSRKKDL